MAYGLDGNITLGPQNEKRFAELVEDFEAKRAQWEELRTLQSQRQQEQKQHSMAMAGVNIDTDPAQLGQGYQLRDAQSEVIAVIEAKVGEAQRLRDAARNAIDRFVGNANGLYSGYLAWLKRVEHAQGEADKLKAQWEQ